MDYKNNINFRKQKLIQLFDKIKLYENDIIEALKKDFNKSPFESYVTEIAIVYDDLKNTINNINKWAKPKRVLPSILNFPSSDYIYSEPYGKVLIISPWNYPFQLAICPLIGAVAAGNKVTLKPSELTPNTSSILSKIIRETFDAKHVVAILGDKTIAENLLLNRWDYIFFTGSVTVGKLVYQSASKNLTPVTLELGGKNPCIIDETANLTLAAKRIVWGKFLNAGQTCIAPDYLIIHKNIKNTFVKLLITEIQNAYSENAQTSPDYPRIINKTNWQRLKDLINFQNIIYGGNTDEDNLYFAPTLVDEPALDSKIMQDEIFGPVLPLLVYNNFSDLEKIIHKYEKPLALYLFSMQQKNINTILKKFSFGGGCINDTIIHFGNKRLPFGGVGNSGIGAYHGRLTFDLFSHQKSIVVKANWLDIPLRYAPYKNKLKWIKKLI